MTGNVFCKSAVILAAAILQVAGDLSARQPGILRETASEFFGSADFNGDGLEDLVIIDKQTGKYRLGYLGTNRIYEWVDCRPSGIKGISGASISSTSTATPRSCSQAAASLATLTAS